MVDDIVGLQSGETLNTLADWKKRDLSRGRIKLVCFTLVILMTSTTDSFTSVQAQGDCANQSCKDRLCKADFSPLIDGKDFVGLSRFFAQRPADDYCSVGVLDGLRVEATKQVANRAQQALVEQGPDVAQDWLTGNVDATFRLASTWQVNVIRGEIEASRKEWLAAASQFETSYDLYLDELEKTADEQLASNALARRLYLRAMDARHLAGTMLGSISRSGKPGSTLGTRGYVTQTVPVPIEFDTDSAEIKGQGIENVKLVAAMIEAQNIQELEIIGHTDWHGTPAHNDDLSLRRADSVARAIQQNVQKPIRITTFGRGEDCPRIVSQLDQYTEEEIAAMYRRVSLAWARNVNSDLDDCDREGIIER